MLKVPGGRVRPKTLDWVATRPAAPARPPDAAPPFDDRFLAALAAAYARTKPRILEVADERSLVAEWPNDRHGTCVVLYPANARLSEDAKRTGVLLGNPHGDLAPDGGYDLVVWRRSHWPLRRALAAVRELLARDGAVIAEFAEAWPRAARTLACSGWQVARKTWAGNRCAFAATLRPMRFDFSASEEPRGQKADDRRWPKIASPLVGEERASASGGG